MHLRAFWVGDIDDATLEEQVEMERDRAFIKTYMDSKWGDRLKHGSDQRDKRKRSAGPLQVNKLKIASHHPKESRRKTG